MLSLAEGLPSELPKVDVPLGNKESVKGMLDFLKTAALQSKIFPWHLPAMAIAIQAPIAWILFRWLVRSAGEAKLEAAGRDWRQWLGWSATAPAILLAAWLPMLTILHTQSPNLKGKKIVLFEKGYLNWLKPKYGDYGQRSVGMYGMLPIYLESFGAKTLKSPDLSAEDLRDADALVLLLPNEPWKKGQLKRIQQFVERGGKLLVMGEHTVREKDGGSRINDVLKPSGMCVPFDSAVFAVGGWLHSYQPMAHPTSAGIPDEENDFGVTIGGTVGGVVESKVKSKAEDTVERTVDLPWDADPLLVGRWGWSDAGNKHNGAARLGDFRYTRGEKLGDVVLAAERRVGKGSVVVFGDTTPLTNLLTVGCHPYTSRLFGYLGDDSIDLQAARRRPAALLTIVALAAIVIWRPSPLCLIAVAAALGASAAVCTAHTNRAWEILPSGKYHQPNNLAYIDVSHSEAFSRESWRPDGVNAFAMTLMRSGYLALMLPEVTRERLIDDHHRDRDGDRVRVRARLLVSIAPNREFTSKERAAIREFVSIGGIFICTVGYPDAGPSRELLADFGFRVGWAPGQMKELGGEPIPLGHVKLPYPDVPDAVNFVRIHAGWPIHCNDPTALVVSRADAALPVIIIKRYGEGLVAVVGDSGFAMNQNLEQEGGYPIEGAYENAEFWRWFLTLLDEGKVQSAPAPAPANDASGEPSGAAPPNAAEQSEPDASREETP